MINHSQAMSGSEQSQRWKRHNSTQREAKPLKPNENVLGDDRHWHDDHHYSHHNLDHDDLDDEHDHHDGIYDDWNDYEAMKMIAIFMIMER